MELNKFLLFLKCIDGIGDSSIRKLILNNSFSNAKIDSVDDVINFVRKNKAIFSKRFDANSFNEIDVKKAKEKRLKILKTLDEIGAKFVSYFDENYPKRFKEMRDTLDFPILLFYKGDLSLLDKEKTCSIIGTREPSEDTIRLGRDATKKMVEEGYVIISGLAKGCDSLGHSTCLDNNGLTVAILGTGIDTIYPKENKNLAQKILDNHGLLITEELVGFKGSAYSFVNRDRLQASSSDIVITLETNIDGGSMHASKAAVTKYNKKLFVIEPSVLNKAKVSGNIELKNFFGAKAFKNNNELGKLL